jgi:hypothetical protein
MPLGSLILLKPNPTMSPEAAAIPAPAQQLHEGPEDVVLVDHAHQVLAVHDRQAADVAVGHDPRRLLHRRVFVHRGHVLHHQHFHGDLGQQGGDLPEGEQGGGGRRRVVQIGCRDDAHQGAVGVDHGHAVDLLLVHELQRVGHGRVGVQHGGFGDHQFANEHSVLLEKG